MSLELNDSSHIIIRSDCLVNFVSEVKVKRTVMKVLKIIFSNIQTHCCCYFELPTKISYHYE